MEVKVEVEMKVEVEVEVENKEGPDQVVGGWRGRS